MPHIYQAVRQSPPPTPTDPNAVSAVYVRSGQAYYVDNTGEKTLGGGTPPTDIVADNLVLNVTQLFPANTQFNIQTPIAGTNLGRTLGTVTLGTSLADFQGKEAIKLELNGASIKEDITWNATNLFTCPIPVGPGDRFYVESP